MNKLCSIVMLALALAGGAAVAAPLRDPFARPAAPPAAPAPAAVDTVPEPAPAPVPVPVLKAIMYEPRHSLANIGGQILTVGEWYGHYRIVGIEERSVTLLRNKVKSVLVLDKESSK